MEEKQTLTPKKINNGDGQNSSEDGRITIKHWGKTFAQDTNCNPEAIGSGLDSVYSSFLKDQKLDKKALEIKIGTLKEDIEKLNQKNQDIKANNKNLEITNEKYAEDIENNKEEIVKLDNQILDVTNGKGAKPDKTMYNLFLILTIIFTIAVIFSYAGTFGSSVVGLRESDRYYRGDVFSALKDQGILNFILSMIVIPGIPIGLGFTALYLKKRKHLSASPIISLLLILIVLIVDVVIGYRLSETIYNSQYERGLHDKEWEFEYIFSDVNFYVIIAINFAIYMAFSLFANLAFEEYDKLHPSAIVVKLQNQIDRLKEIIEELKNKILENKKAIESNRSEIEKNQMTIEKKQRDIDDYKAGKLPINIEDLKGIINQFLSGYQAYTNIMIEDSKKAESIVNRAYQNTENWFKNKMENGWSNDVEISFNKNLFNND